MKFYSTNNPKALVPFRQAVFDSMPADRGLYMPVSIPRLQASFIGQLDQLSLPQIACAIATELLGDDIPPADLETIVGEAINFPAPLVQLEEDVFVLELFHGPSLAFKDFGARFMSRVMSYFLRDGEKTLDVLVATSGDTGGAVALGFLGVPNTRVTILYPKGKVSAVQELQLTTNGGNIRALEIDGTFDDCQALVKQAFTDPALNTQFRLTSANSINMARLIPQTFYYFGALGELRRRGKNSAVFSVPSGNFGNLTAGVLAWKMGLPVQHFIAATNANDTVPQFLRSGVYRPKPSVQTMANAMDVGDPSNWVRIVELFGHDAGKIAEMVTGFSYSDEEDRAALENLYAQHGYIACPHTAIAWQGLKDWQQDRPSGGSAGVFLSTAHPCKFPDVLPPHIASGIAVPEQVVAQQGKPRRVTALGTDFGTFKSYLMDHR